MDQDKKNDQRLTELESTLMHLQNDYDSLNAVVRENTGRIEQMAKAIERLTARLESVSESEQERNAEDEVPPHY